MNQTQYNLAISSHLSQRITGSIVLKDGTVEEITNENIYENSFSYNNKCVDSSDFDIGSCYIGELKIAIKTRANRYLFYGAKLDLIISITDGIDEASKQYKNFTISEAVREGDELQITAYDPIMLLDDEITEGTTSTPYGIISFICDRYDIETNIDKQYIDSISPKYTASNLPMEFAISYQNNGTYRTALKQTAAILGGFITVDDGYLTFKRPETTAGTEISGSIILSAKISDYFIKYDGLYTKIQETDGTEKTYFAGEKEGILFELPTIKMLYSGLDEDHQQVLDNLWLFIKTIKYYPVDLTLPDSPFFTLGEPLQVYNRYDGSYVQTTIQSIDYSIYHESTIRSYGSNPVLSSYKAISSPTQSQGSGGGSSYATSSFKLFNWSNAIGVGVLHQNERTLANLELYAQEENAPFSIVGTASIQSNIDTKANIYYYDQYIQQKAFDTVYLKEGTNTIHFHHFGTIKSTLAALVIGISIKCEEEDTELEMPAGFIRASVFGVLGAVSEKEFDGNMEDRVPYYKNEGYKTHIISEEIKTKTETE